MGFLLFCFVLFSPENIKICKIFIRITFLSWVRNFRGWPWISRSQMAKTFLLDGETPLPPAQLLLQPHCSHQPVKGLSSQTQRCWWWGKDLSVPVRDCSCLSPRAAPGEPQLRGQGVPSTSIIVSDISE